MSRTKKITIIGSGLGIAVLLFVMITIFQQTGNGEWTSNQNDTEGIIIEMPIPIPSDEVLDKISQNANVTRDKAMFGYLQSGGNVDEVPCCEG